jgi:hypothetical protein
MRAMASHESTFSVLILFRSVHARENPHCAVGLGVTAMHTVRVLRRNGIAARSYGVATVEHVVARLIAHPETTHCVLEAPWLPTASMRELLARFPDVHFIVRSHSQIGFLQVEPAAIRLLRELQELEDHVLNLSIAANSEHLSNFFERTYAGRCLHLPNLYDVERTHRPRRHRHDHRLLRVSSFGATRLLKNHTTAAAAALLLARARHCDLEFHMNADTEGHGGLAVIDAVRAMFEGLAWARLVVDPWRDWGSFRRIAGHMDLAMQLSMTETFNVTSADAVCEGVPCVVTPVVEWAPNHWKVGTDAIEDAARVAGHLLADGDAAADGLACLREYVERSVDAWRSTLEFTACRERRGARAAASGA